MPIFIKYTYQIAGENDIKRSMTSVAQHAEKENRRVYQAQSKARSSIGGAGAANSNASVREAEVAERARIRSAQNATKAEQREAKRAADFAVKEHQREERAKTRETERGARERAKIESDWSRKQSRLKDQHFRDTERRQRDEERLTARHRAQVYQTTRGIATGTVGRVTSFGRGALAVSGVGGIALAANALHEGMTAERSASGLANQMAAAGETPEQLKARQKGILHAAEAVRGASTNDAIGAARTFGGISGNYALGQEMTPDLAQISLATDVQLEEISKVAGNAYMKLKTPDMSEGDAKKLTLDAVRAFAGQGNVGAVEIKDLAQYGGRLTAGAAKFEGSRIENMKRMGALAQVAVGSGSATDAAEATEAAVRFADDLTMHAEKVGALKLGGKNITAFTDPGKGPGKNTQLRGIKELVGDVVEATGGSLPQMQSIFGVRSQKVTEAFQRKYLEAESANEALAPEKRMAKGKAGRAAIEAEFDTFDKAALSEKDQSMRAEAALATTSAQAEAAMKKMNSALANELLPVMPQLISSFASLAPPLAEIVRGAAAVASWLAANPFAGLSTLIAAAFLNQLAAAKVGEIVKGLFLGKGAPVPGGAGAPAGGGGKLGGALGAAGVGLAAGAMVYSAIDMAGKADYDNSVKVTSDISKNLVNLQGPELGMGLIEAKQQLKKYEEDKGFLGGAFSGMMNVFGAGDATEVKSLEKLIQSKEAEYEKYRKGGGGENIAEQKKAAETQLKAAQMLQKAAESFAANAPSGSGSGSAPNRGNAPSPVKS
jgi:hypothetical protein